MANAFNADLLCYLRMVLMVLACLQWWGRSVLGGEKCEIKCKAQLIWTIFWTTCFCKDSTCLKILETCIFEFVWTVYVLCLCNLIILMQCLKDCSTIIFLFRCFRTGSIHRAINICDLPSGQHQHIWSLVSLTCSTCWWTPKKLKVWMHIMHGDARCMPGHGSDRNASWQTVGSLSWRLNTDPNGSISRSWLAKICFVKSV